MATPVLPISLAAPNPIDDVSSTQQVSHAKADKTAAAAKASTNAASNQTPAPKPPYIVTLSKAAQVQSLKQHGSSISVIAVELGLSKEEVDSSLGIATTVSGEVAATTVPSLL
jgi:hypothetical protein